MASNSLAPFDGINYSTVDFWIIAFVLGNVCISIDTNHMMGPQNTITHVCRLVYNAAAIKDYSKQKDSEETQIIPHTNLAVTGEYHRGK